MTDFLLILFLIAASYCFATIIAALRRVYTGGINQTEEFLRSGVTFGGLFRGRVPKQEAGSLITIREGLSFTSDNGEIELAQTSTISRDLY